MYLPDFIGPSNPNSRLKPKVSSSRTMAFQRGDQVEVLNKEEGFEGSYFPAYIISRISYNEYIVQYKTLVKGDGSGPLREVFSTDKIRPKPREIVATDYCLSEVVDAYANEGWWVGKIIRKMGSKYLVYFESSNEETPYPLHRLRVHQEWRDGVWEYSKK
ncbi:hypothetical protein L1987_47890 [Smallanthus sonchifolius]|uniref:Uncharacterized protein n=1 Tax=Smallanthus sonchifolius TaxID=185202 RepID=A0ACB9FPS0_9ASTR|nr:hypothetical protein L1987_47890 [Smallanthus sonchifolius]